MVKEVVILAAGEGKRMKRNTIDQALLTTPKPLLEINGKSIIARKIETFLKAGFRIIIVVNQSDKKMFIEKLNKYPIVYCTQGNEKGTAAALVSAKDAVKDDFFLVIMGDDLYDLDLEYLKHCNAPIVFGFEVADVSNYGVLVMDKDENVIDILEKQKSGRGMANTGSYIMPKEFFDVYSSIPADEKSGERFLTHIVKILDKKGFKFKEKKLKFWFGINTPEQFKAAESILDESEKT